MPKEPETERFYLDHPIEKYSLYWWALLILCVILLVQGIRGFFYRLYYWDFLYVLIASAGIGYILVQDYLINRFQRKFVEISTHRLILHIARREPVLQIDAAEIEALHFSPSRIDVHTKKGILIPIPHSGSVRQNEKISASLRNFAERHRLDMIDDS